MVMVDGTARVEIGGQTIATIGPGEFFGEIALLDGGPRTATVIAETDTVAEVIGQREFSGLVEDSPHLAKKLLVGLARRLRAADVQLAG
jgi:CRP-like cAMP-binding protein